MREREKKKYIYLCFIDFAGTFIIIYLYLEIVVVVEPFVPR